MPVSDQLRELLGRLGAHAAQLDDTHQLEDFQRQAAEVCGSCELSLAHLKDARAALRDTTPADWELLAEAGVVLTDAVKCAY
jgi:hypothetical protein